jgi:hypothetical protein
VIKPIDNKTPAQQIWRAVRFVAALIVGYGLAQRGYELPALVIWGATALEALGDVYRAWLAWGRKRVEVWIRAKNAEHGSDFRWNVQYDPDQRVVLIEIKPDGDGEEASESLSLWVGAFGRRYEIDNVPAGKPSTLYVTPAYARFVEP